MKITNKFISDLTQLSQINSNLFLEKGSTVELRADNKQLMCKVDLDVEVPSDAGILSTATFIQALSLFNQDETEIKFQEKLLTIEDDKNVCTYRLPKPEYVNTKPTTSWDKLINDHLRDPEFTVNIKTDDFDYLKKTQAVMKSQHIALVSKEGSLKFVCMDAKIQDGNSFSISLAEGDYPEFKYTFNAEDILKINPQDFKMNVYKLPTIMLEGESFSFILPALTGSVSETMS